MYHPIAIIFFITSVVTLVFGILLVTGKRLSRGHRIMGAAYFCGMAALLTFAIYIVRSPLWSDVLSTYFGLLVMPLFYISTCDVTTLDGVSQHQVRAAILPALIVATLNLLVGFIMGPEQLAEYIKTVDIGGNFADMSPLWMAKRIIGSYLFRACLMVETILMYIFIVRKMNAYNRMQREYYTYTAENTKTNYFMIRMGILALLLGLASIAALPYTMNQKSPLFVIIYCVLISSADAIVYIYSIKQKHTARDLKRMIDREEARLRKEAEEAGPDVVNFNVPEEIKARLDKLLEDEVYLDPELTLITLAQQVGSNRTYLSKVIHTSYGCSFSELINNKRVEYAVNLMMVSTQEKLFIKDIARISGFSTTLSFTRNFERIYEMNVSDWIALNRPTPTTTKTD